MMTKTMTTNHCARCGKSVKWDDPQVVVRAWECELFLSKYYHINCFAVAHANLGHRALDVCRDNDALAAFAAGPDLD